MRVAVYGTLKNNRSNHRLLDGARYLGEHITQKEYTMYSNGGYPAIIHEGNTAITCEVYETANSEQESNLNRLEGFISKGNPRNFYDRETIATKYGDAEIYIFNSKPESSYWSEVESGVF